VPLTDAAVRNAKPGGAPLKIYDGLGLYLLVQPQGGKLWRLKYQFDGKEKLLSLGSYGDVLLKEARRKREEARELLREGKDPSQLRKEQKAAQILAATNSYEAVARMWHAHWKGNKNAKHAAGVLARLERDVFPTVGPLPFESVTARQLVQAALKIEERGAPEYAKRALQTAAQIGRYSPQSPETRCRRTLRRESQTMLATNLLLRPSTSLLFAALDSESPLNGGQGTALDAEQPILALPFDAMPRTRRRRSKAARSRSRCTQVNGLGLANAAV